MKHWSDTITRMHACPNAVAWLQTQPDAKTAWRVCKRGDWMLWLIWALCKTADDRKALVLAACACARLALKYIPKHELRPLRAIETAEAWGRGGCTERPTAVGNDALRAAHDLVVPPYTVNSDHSLFKKMVTQREAAEAAACAFYATAAGPPAGSVIEKTRRKCADIVRQHYPKSPL